MVPPQAQARRIIGPVYRRASGSRREASRAAIVASIAEVAAGTGFYEVALHVKEKVLETRLPPRSWGSGPA
jgi:hypothetical protein